MITVEDAIHLILENVTVFLPERRPLADSRGLFLSGDVVSDVDSPPFDKSLMDGYAVRSADVPIVGAELKVVEEITAGSVGTQEIHPGEAARIMTGAPIPHGADAVIRQEDTRFDEATGTVTITVGGIAAGNDLMKRGTSMRSGDVVLPTGRTLRPQELGALAEMGVAAVSVRRRPKVAILATGDELVPVGEAPGPGQIRNSNESMLIAQVQQALGDPVPLGIARDNREDLGAKIRSGLEHDLLLLSGGVSAGKRDLVPSELESAGVQQVFHKVNVKPGKPVWFGILPGRCAVFGLPGNPVSSMVCFELFARTALRRMLGDPHPAPQPLTAILGHSYHFRGDRKTYHPCRVEHTANGRVVHIGKWLGSADLRSTVESNAMAIFEPGERRLAERDVIEVIPW